MICGLLIGSELFIVTSGLMICDDVKCRCDDTVVPKFSLSNTPP